MELIHTLIPLFIFLSSGIVLLIYSKKKKTKAGLTISILILLLPVLILMENTIDEFTFSKEHIVLQLEDLDIELKDDFKILKNNIAGIRERIQDTEIQISKKDKDIIISNIKSSANLKVVENKQEALNQTEWNGQVFNFKYPEFYSSEIYMIIDERPIQQFILIGDKENLIRYKRIEN